MKLRSLLLVSCMLVVPALAIFSHLIPTEFRAAARRSFAAATSGWLGTPAEAGTVPFPTTPLSPTPNQTTPNPPTPNRPATSTASVAGTGLMPVTAAAPPTTATLAPAPTGLPPAAAGAPATAANPLSAGTPSVATAEPATPALVAQLADRTRQARDQQARDQQGIEAQLTAIGAVSFDCQPLPGSEGLYSSSCRVPVDATGQLQRVFQASGRDPGSASAALLEQVMAWRQRIASQPPAAAVGGPDGGAGGPPAGRVR